MRLFRTISNHPTLLGRGTAWAGVAMVVLLAWLSVDPAAHAWLHKQEKSASVSGCGHSGHGPSHGDDHGDQPQSHEDDGCAVARYAQGQVDCAVAPVVVATPLAQHDRFVWAGNTAFVAAADRRLPPVCGPPLV